jgi:hypothetical protein
MVSELATNLGRKIADVRREAGLTQAQLADAVGLERTGLSKIESGHRDVSALELARLARALGRSPGWFLDDRPPASLRRLRRLRARILEVARRHGASNVRVFGSVARGEGDERSDVDLLVDMKPDHSLFDLAALAVDLRELLGRDVDVATLAALKPRVRDRIVREAVPL